MIRLKSQIIKIVILFHINEYSLCCTIKYILIIIPPRPLFRTQHLFVLRFTTCVYLSPWGGGAGWISRLEFIAMSEKGEGRNRVHYKCDGLKHSARHPLLNAFNWQSAGKQTRSNLLPVATGQSVYWYQTEHLSMRCAGVRLPTQTLLCLTLSEISEAAFNR